MHFDAWQRETERQRKNTSSSVVYIVVRMWHFRFVVSYHRHSQSNNDNSSLHNNESTESMCRYLAVVRVAHVGDARMNQFVVIVASCVWLLSLKGILLFVVAVFFFSSFYLWFHTFMASHNGTQPHTHSHTRSHNMIQFHSGCIVCGAAEILYDIH